MLQVCTQQRRMSVCCSLVRLVRILGGACRMLCTLLPPFPHRRLSGLRSKLSVISFAVFSAATYHIRAQEASVREAVVAHVVAAAARF